MGVIASLEREIEAAERRAAALRKVVEAAEELGEAGMAEVFHLFVPNGNGSNGNGSGDAHNSPPFVQEPMPDEEPRGRAAVRYIVSERPGIWTLADLRAEMSRRGWLTTEKAMDTAVARLCKRGEGRRVGKGRYVFPADYREEGLIESEPVGVTVIAPE